MQEFALTRALSYRLGEANKEDAREQVLDALLTLR